MEPRHWAIAGASAVVVTCIGIALILQANSTTNEEADGTSTSVLEVENEEPANETVAPLEPEGPQPGPADPSHGFPEIDESKITDSADFVDVPPQIVTDAENVARAWLTYDSSLPRSDREKQLAEVIPNPEEWAQKKPRIQFYKPQAAGNPSWRTNSEVLGIKTVPGFETGIDGVYTVPVEVSFSAKYTSGGGNDRGSLTTVSVWEIKFDLDGNLIDIEEPDI